MMPEEERPKWNAWHRAGEAAVRRRRRRNLIKKSSTESAGPSVVTVGMK